MAQIQRLRTEKNQIFLPVRKDADNLQTVVSAAEEAGDVMNLSQNVVETFIFMYFLQPHWVPATWRSLA